MVLLDLLGRRWALRVLWELRQAPLTFRGLRERCDEISPTVLNARLRELREARLVEHRTGSGYALTPDGKALLGVLEPVKRWAGRWARHLQDGNG
jgi:DNA-binding HxlR family transcriptional regulator